MGRIAGRFARVEPRLRASRLVLGLLSDLPRKNCWTIAEWAGENTPHSMQHLPCRASRDADAVRDDVREYVVEHLHDEAAVLVVDETGDVKKGIRTVGVQRQYTGTAGRIENSQVAVYLVHAGARGHAAVDRELYVPRSWTADSGRCGAAGLGEETVFATKPELARVLIERGLSTSEIRLQAGTALVEESMCRHCKHSITRIGDSAWPRRVVRGRSGLGGRARGVGSGDGLSGRAQGAISFDTRSPEAMAPSR